jgi:hypothetical protein
MPVRFMPNFNLELEFVHIAESSSFEDDIGLEIARVIRVPDEGFHFVAKKLDVFEGGVEGDEHVELFFHSFAASDVLDPEGVEDDVGYLNHFHIVDSFEDCEEEGDLLHDKQFVPRRTDDVDAITDIVGVFDEEEDTGAEEFLGGYGKDKGEREESGSGGCKGCDEVGVLEGNF